MDENGYSQSAQDHGLSLCKTIFKLIFTGFFLLGLCCFVEYWLDNANETKSAAWPTTTATVQELTSHGADWPVVGPYVPFTWPYARYSYTVGNMILTGEEKPGPSLTFIRDVTYTPPAPRAFDQKTAVTIHYQKDRPEVSYLDPQILQSSISQLYSSIFLMVVGAVVLGGIFYHQYVNAPDPYDPNLSIEAALDTQRKR